MSQKLSVFVLLIIGFGSCKSDYFPSNAQSQKVNYPVGDSLISFSYLNSKIKTKPDLSYHWFSNGVLGETKGTYIGSPLMALTSFLIKTSSHWLLVSLLMD
ncbi:hypothetical protein [Marinoscillum sp.]|uniref:hypothetical protein n=1 Tax=Marinoscillum sp. TaxID=2024838 RepID=UPI003BAC4D89